MNLLSRIINDENVSDKKSVLILIIILLIFPGVFAQVNLSELTGEIKDEQGGLILNTSIKLKDENGKEYNAVSNNGSFRFENLLAGAYSLQVSAEGFAAHEEKIKLTTSDKILKISIVLYPSVKEEVEVTAIASDSDALSADRAAGTQVLTVKDLATLPDDPEQFVQALQQLAASSGGVPGGALVTVDGFLNDGRLPSKSAISQVKINPNLYSAEYNAPPFRGGRIEITTKPGADSLTGSAFFNYNGTALNARDPLAQTRAETQVRRYGFQLGGPIIKQHAGYFIDFEKRDIDDAAAINAIILDDNLQPSFFTANMPTPKRLLIGSARADWQINQSHTLIVRNDFSRNKLFNQGIGGSNLSARAFDTSQKENNLRLTETAVVNSHTANELRVGLTLSQLLQSALTDEPSIIVAGAFASGGASLQKLAHDEKRLEIADNLTLDTKKHGFKFGFQIFNRRTDETRAENTNGSFFFGGASDEANEISSLEQYRRTLLSLPGGVPTRFSVSIGSPRVSVNQWLFAGFVQDEWKLTPKMLLSLGLRYEAQTAPSEPRNFAPRIGLAYAPDKKQKWVFRARAGIFYESISDSLALENERLDGKRQQQIIVDSPAFSNPLLNAAGSSVIRTIRTSDSILRSPASLQLRLEFERQLSGGWKLTSSYSLSRGWSLLRSRNINAPVVDSINSNPQSAPRPFGINENVLQFESSGSLKGRVLFVGVNQNTNRFFTVNAGYLHFDFQSDTDTPFTLPQSSYDLTGERARPFWQMQDSLFLVTTINLPRKIRLFASFNASAGTPFNITTGRDNNGDGNFNDRPGISALTGVSIISTKFGFLEPGSINGNLPRNSGTNPGTAALDLNLSRTFVLGQKSVQGDGRYKLTANVRATNVLNRSNLTGTNGVLSSPLFGLPTTANQARRIELGLRFNF